MLTISGTKFGFQFPTVGNKVVCNPPDGYSPEAVHSFYKVPQILEEMQFSGAQKCVVNHNPSVFFRVPSRVEFGLAWKFGLAW